MSGKSWWSSQRWLNRGSAGSLYFGSGRVFLFLILWIIPHAGDDMLGGNVGTTGTFFLVVMTCGAILAILFVYIILLVF